MVNKKNVIWNVIGSTTTAFTSLIFTIIVTRINGLSDAGIFTYCFATSCLFYMIALYSGRIFQVTDITGKYSDTDYLYHREISCFIMIMFTIMFTLIKQYDMTKTMILIILSLYKCIEAFSESIYGIIQKNGQLYKVGISLFLKAIFSILIFLVVDIFSNNLLISSIVILIVNILVLLLYDFNNLRKIKYAKTKFNSKLIVELFKVGFFTFCLLFLGNYLVNTSRYAIDDLLTNDFQTIFGIIIMPATFMGLLGQYIIQPSLNDISSFIKNQDFNNLKNKIIKLISWVLSLGILVVLIAYFLEAPVLELVYGIELDKYKISMFIIIIGSIFYGLSFLLSSILIAMRKTKEQTIVYGIVSIISTIFGYIMVDELNILGASINYLITMLGISIIFLIYLMYNMKIYNKCWKVKL